MANLALAPRPEIAERGTADLDLRVARTDRLGLTVRPLLAVPTRAGRRRADAVRAGVCGSVDVAGTANVVFASPERYSTIRIRQIEATFGFDNVIGTALPWEMVEPTAAASPPSSATRSCPPCRRSASAACTTSNFRSGCLTEIVEEHGDWLAGYDEIWVYSEFVRRNVNGLIRHYGLEAPPIRLIPPHAMWSGAVGGLPWPERRTILTVGRFFTGGHNKRQDVVIEAFRRRAGRRRRGRGASPWPAPSTRALKAGSGSTSCSASPAGLHCTFYPNIGRADLAASTSSPPC